VLRLILATNSLDKLAVTTSVLYIHYIVQLVDADHFSSIHRMDMDHFSSTHRMRYTQLNVRYNWNMDVQSGRDTSCESANQVTWHTKVMSL
jgi:hypothetical protein